MISRITGTLLAIEGARAELQCSDIVYEILIPAADVMRLGTQVGEEIELFTMHYLESHGQGTSFVPRLIGFQSPQQRQFFELFTTVKGMGNRKALRALQLPIPDIAAAIAGKDADLLKTLPEIGKRTADTIIAELSGKVDQYLEWKPSAGEGDSTVDAAHHEIVRDAISVLVQLGESRAHAQQWVDRALRADPEIDTADALIAAAFRLKSLA